MSLLLFSSPTRLTRTQLFDHHEFALSHYQRPKLSEIAVCTMARVRWNTKVNIRHCFIYVPVDMCGIISNIANGNGFTYHAITSEFPEQRSNLFHPLVIASSFMFESRWMQDSSTGVQTKNLSSCRAFEHEPQLLNSSWVSVVQLTLTFDLSV